MFAMVILAIDMSQLMSQRVWCPRLHYCGEIKPLFRARPQRLFWDPPGLVLVLVSRYGVIGSFRVREGMQILYDLAKRDNIEIRANKVSCFPVPARFRHDDSSLSPLQL
mgnify:FL=1